MSEKMRHIIRRLLMSLVMVCLCGAIAVSQPASAQEKVRVRTHGATLEEKVWKQRKEEGVSEEHLRAGRKELWRSDHKSDKSERHLDDECDANHWPATSELCERLRVREQLEEQGVWEEQLKAVQKALEPGEPEGHGHGPCDGLDLARCSRTLQAAPRWVHQSE